MIPLAAGLLIGQAAYQGYQAYQNKQEADRLARLGPQDPTPLAFRQMQQNLANQSNNAQIAGYGQAMDNLNEGMSSTLGEAKRAGITSSNTLNVLTRLNQQRNRALRDLSIQGQQQQQMRQNRYNEALGVRGQYQEQGRQENARAVGALRGASKQNVFNAITSGIGAAANIGGIPSATATSATGQSYTSKQMEGVDASMQNLQQNGNPDSFYQPQLANPYLNFYQNR